MPFDFLKRSKTERPTETLRTALGEELTPEERAYLAEIERRAKADYDFDNPANVEAELQKRERERLEKTFRPQNPLYPASSHNNRSGEPQAVKGKPEETPDNSQQKSYQNDPRYREYFERLRREGVQPPPASKYDENVTPTSLDELDRTGWKSPSAAPKPRSAPKPAPPAPAPPPSGQSSSFGRPKPAAPAPTAGDEMQPGALMRFDDGSAAVYKDAVSGKDYALFYFLEANGALAPRGIFLEQYGQQKIGQIPLTLLDQMIERKRWDRDAVIFHLDKYDFASCIPQSTPGATSSHGAASSSSNSTASWRNAGSQSGSATSRTPSERRPATRPETGDSGSWAYTGPPKRDSLLERGRVLRINVGGRLWESVYWTEDEIGAIVAHNTNKVWALMHLDLNRFKDSLEHGDVMSYEELSEIEQSLAGQSK